MKMKKWKRTLIFWTLAFLFLITTPVIVLNARGYRFDISRGVFVYSGTITFKSNPQTVDVKLNGDLRESKKLNMINNSYNLSGLLPRTYDFQVSAEGFQTWKKRTDVHSGLANEFWNILLVRNEYEKTDNELLGIDKFFTASSGEFIAYTANENSNFSIKIYDTAGEKILVDFNVPEWHFANKEKKENIEWSPDEKFISVPVQKNSEEGVLYDYLIADLENKTIFNLNDFLGKNDVKNVRWDSQKKEYLYFISENILYRSSVKNALDTVEIASDISTFDVSREEIYYSTLTNNLIFRYGSAGKVEQITSNFPGPAESIIATMIVYDEQRIALILENKDLFIFNRGEHGNHFRKLKNGVREAHFSDDGKKMLYWNDFEIGAYYLRDELSQPVQIEDDQLDITRYSEPLANVQWFNDYEHIIFSTGRWTKIIELDDRDQRNCMDIINTRLENPFVVYNNRLKKLFFTDQKEESTSLFSIDFPEENSLFGALGFGG